MWFVFNSIYSKLRLCAHEVVSERFSDSQNKNDMNCTNSHCIKFLVFVLRRGSCGFSLIKLCQQDGSFFRQFGMKTLGNDTVCT